METNIEVMKDICRGRREQDHNDIVRICRDKSRAIITGYPIINS